MNWGRIRTLVEKQLTQLGAPIETYALDLLGHANRHSSQKEENAHLALINDLEKQIQEKSIGPCIALGHSFGLRPLLLLGEKRPELFPYIIAEDTSPTISMTAYTRLKEILNNAPLPFTSRDEAKSFFDAKYGASSALSRFLHSNIKEKSFGQHSWRFDHVFLNQLLDEAVKNPLWNQWSNFKGSISIIYGDKSDLISPSLLAELQTKRPQDHSNVYKVSNAGHWIHADQPEAFVESVVNVIQKIRTCDRN